MDSRRIAVRFQHCRFPTDLSSTVIWHFVANRSDAKCNRTSDTSLRRIYATNIVEGSTEHSARIHLIMATPGFEVGPALLQSLCVCVYVCVCICVCVYVCICVCMCVYVCVLICVCVCMCVCIYACVCVYKL